MMVPDGRALRLGEPEAALVEDIEGTAPVAASVTPSCLPEVVEEGCHGYTTIRNWDAARVGAYVLIYFKGVEGEAAVLLVVAVAATPEVGG